ncbi:hypothetical protein VNO77_00686 [Canavalia gladiata]|uniref:Uncharacterized protein n=1 Tax=Canavalia gladiata TaxID=3824 RepID=A0AAN9MWD3_CANGL
MSPITDGNKPRNHVVETTKRLRNEEKGVLSPGPLAPTATAFIEIHFHSILQSQNSEFHNSLTQILRERRR